MKKTLGGHHIESTPSDYLHHTRLKTPSSHQVKLANHLTSTKFFF